jgi:hypothetical protein
MSRLRIVNVVHGPTVLLSATRMLRSQVTRIKVCIRTLYKTVYNLVCTACFCDNLYQVQTKYLNAKQYKSSNEQEIKRT